MKCEKLTSENRREFIREASKIIHEWDGYLETLGRPSVIENYKQYFLLQTAVLQKQSLSAPMYVLR